MDGFKEQNIDVKLVIVENVTDTNMQLLKQNVYRDDEQIKGTMSDFFRHAGRCSQVEFLINTRL